MEGKMLDVLIKILSANSSLSGNALRDAVGGR